MPGERCHAKARRYEELESLTRAPNGRQRTGGSFPASPRCGFVLGYSRSITGTSAAQKALVINICSKCGAILFEDASRCSFCNAPLVQSAQPDESVRADEFARVPANAVANDVEPDWRLEVARRLELYRARRR